MLLAVQQHGRGFDNSDHSRCFSDISSSNQW